MSQTQVCKLRDALDYLKSLQDGKPHGACGGCDPAIGRNIFVESWIVPLIKTVHDELEDQELKRVYRSSTIYTQRQIASKRFCAGASCYGKKTPAAVLKRSGSSSSWYCDLCGKEYGE